MATCMHSGIENAADTCIWSLLGFTCFFAIGAGPIPFVYMAEILPEEIKAPASALAIGSNWLANILIAVGFPLVVHLLGIASAFAVFAAINMCAVAFGGLLMRETKKKTLSEVHQLLLLHE